MKVEVTDEEYLNLIKTLPVNGKDFRIYMYASRGFRVLHREVFF